MSIRFALLIACAAVVLLAARPGWATFMIHGSSSGAGLVTQASSVPDPDGFSVSGTSPADVTVVQFYRLGTYSDDYLSWTNEMTFRADAATGEIGAALLSQTAAGSASRVGPFSAIDAWMTDTFSIEPDPLGIWESGDEVQIAFQANWTGYILLEGSPNFGAFVYYQSRLVGGLGGVSVLSEFESTDSNLYPLADYTVNRSHSEIVTVNVGDSVVIEQYISFDLNGSSYSGTTSPLGRNDLDFLNAGQSQLGYAPGYETLNIWSSAGATIVPEPTTALLLSGGLAGLAAAGRRRR